MNWEAIGTISEVIGAIAVVISIIYLASQISANTKAVKANAGFDATHSWAAFNEVMATSSDDHLQMLMRSFDPNESWDTFSDIERARIGVSFRALFQKLEGQYYLYRYEHLDEGLWKNRATFASGMLQKPFFERWWEIEKDQRVYSDDFVKALDATKPIQVNQEVLGAKNAPASEAMGSGA